jgi:hypothetical protein
MELDKFEELILKNESPKLEFKQFYKLSLKYLPEIDGIIQKEIKTNQEKEIIRDIIAITNGSETTASEPAYLLIGVDDTLDENHKRALFDTSDLAINEFLILNMVNGKCNPPIPDLKVEQIIIEEKVIHIIIIPPTPYVHELKETMVIYKFNDYGKRNEKPTTYVKNSVLVRRGQGVEVADQQVRVALAISKGAQLNYSAQLILEPFLIQKRDRDRINFIYVKSKIHSRLSNSIRKCKVVGIIGPPGNGKQTTALKVAQELNYDSIYIIPRSIKWSEIKQANLINSFIILPDTLGAVRFERENLDNELYYLERIIKNKNQIVFTSQDEIFLEAIRETHIQNWLQENSYEIISLPTESYSYDKKIQIFNNLVSYAVDSLTPWQKTEALNLIKPISDINSEDNFDESKNRRLFQGLLLRKWIPVDIERFVINSLPSINSSSKLLDKLRLDADLEHRVHTWFTNLDASIQVFILTLTIFAGFPSTEVWNRYKEIVYKLQKLNSGLYALPLGVARQRCAPYVTLNGNPDFAYPRIYQAFINEISKNFREYFIDLLDVLIKWTIPPDKLEVETQKTFIQNNINVTASIAKMVGEVGSYSFAEVKPLITTWAEYPLGSIAKNAGIALQRVAMDPIGAQIVMDTIDEWCRGNRSQSKHLRWAAGSALWRLGNIQSSYDFSQFVLKNIIHLSGDSDDYVASTAAYALRMLWDKYSPEQIFPIIERLMRLKDQYIIEYLTDTLELLCLRNIKDVSKFLQGLSISPDMKTKRFVVRYVLISRKLSLHCRTIILTQALQIAPNVLSDVLFDNKNIENISQNLLKELFIISDSNKKLGPTLISIFSEIQFPKYIEDLLISSRLEDNELLSLRSKLILEQSKQEYHKKKLYEIVSTIQDKMLKSSDSLILFLLQYLVLPETKDLVMEAFDKVNISSKQISILVDGIYKWAKTNIVDWNNIELILSESKNSENTFESFTNIVDEIHNNIVRDLYCQFKVILDKNDPRIVQDIILLMDNPLILPFAVQAIGYLLDNPEFKNSLRDIISKLEKEDYFTGKIIRTQLLNLPQSINSENIITFNGVASQLYNEIDETFVLELNDQLRKILVIQPSKFLGFLIEKMKEPLAKNYIFQAFEILYGHYEFKQQIILIFADQYLNNNVESEYFWRCFNNDADNKELKQQIQLETHEIIIQKIKNTILSSSATELMAYLLKTLEQEQYLPYLISAIEDIASTPDIEYFNQNLYTITNHNCEFIIKIRASFLIKNVGFNLDIRNIILIFDNCLKVYIDNKIREAIRKPIDFQILIKKFLNDSILSNYTLDVLESYIMEPTQRVRLTKTIIALQKRPIVNNLEISSTDENFIFDFFHNCDRQSLVNYLQNLDK